MTISFQSAEVLLSVAAASLPATTTAPQAPRTLVIRNGRQQTTIALEDDRPDQLVQHTEKMQAGRQLKENQSPLSSRRVILIRSRTTCQLVEVEVEVEMK